LKKRYGQHFISDRNILQRIVLLSGVGSRDIVVEIGPGRGTLTRELAQAAGRVVAIEIDGALIPDLRAGAPPNVEIIHGDALVVDFQQAAGGLFHVVGNLPFNVATPLIKKFVAERARIAEATVMIQKEVAERMVAEPATPAYGPLAILVQYYARVTWGFVIPPGAFTPRPKVDSAVIRLDWKLGVEDNPAFTDFVHRAFSSRRKTLLNNLVAMTSGRSRTELAELLADAGIPPRARPETLSMEQFLRVYNRIRMT